MPISSEAIIGEYTPVIVPDQNYNRLERQDKPSKSLNKNINKLTEISSDDNTNSNGKYLKPVLLIGLITLATIACGVLPAVILSQVLSKTNTVSSYNNTLTNSSISINSNSTTLLSSSSSSSLSSSTSSSTISGSSTTNCPINTCSYSTWYTLTSSGYYGVEHVNINCSETLSNITAIINVEKTVGATFASQYNTFWSGTIYQGYTNTTSSIIYFWTIISGQTISLSGFPYYIEAQFQLVGTNQTVMNDTYTVTTQSACNGQILTYSGNF